MKATEEERKLIRRLLKEGVEFYPDRLCGCGCGGKIEIKKHHKRFGIPNYLRGHCKCSEEKRKKISESHMGEKNGQWKETPTLCSLHEWISKRKPKPEFCECCNKKPPYDLANISQKYKRDVNDFEWLCRYCHMKKDGRLKKLIDIGVKYAKSRKGCLQMSEM